MSLSRDYNEADPRRYEPDPVSDPLGQLATELSEWHGALSRALSDPQSQVLVDVAARRIRDRIGELLAEWPQVVAGIYGTAQPDDDTPPLPPAGDTAAAVRLMRLNTALTVGDNDTAVAAFADLTTDEQRQMIKAALRRLTDPEDTP